MSVVAKSSLGVVDSLPSSGTVAFTVIDTVKVIEHAVRRAGSSASTLTPEQLEAAYDNLYLILMSMINRGVNLWCLEEVLIPLYVNQARYQLPPGTVSIVESRYRTVNILPAVWNLLPSLKSAVLPAPQLVRSLGILMRVPGDFKVAIEYKNSAGAWLSVKEITFTAQVGKWMWTDIAAPRSSAEFRIREMNGLSFLGSEFVLAADYIEQTMVPYNRDDYVGITNKNVAGRPLNYLYEKQITPTMTLWPVPNNTHDVLVVTRQRQVQDVGPLLSKLEIPERWFECIIWMLSKNMAYELPNIQAERITLCTSQAAESLREAELGESDGAPLRILPNISGYTA
jgi:hypothetical protein